jgi:hypothetical protein
LYRTLKKKKKGVTRVAHAAMLQLNPAMEEKKKGVTRVAHAATLQLNPAMEGYSQYEKGNHQDKPHP